MPDASEVTPEMQELRRLLAEEQQTEPGREQAPTYAAETRLALALDLERVLHDLADHLPGEPPALIAWGPGELAQAVADRLTATAREQSP